MAKKVVAVVKIQLDAGSATPAPPVGTALGPHGVQTIGGHHQSRLDSEGANPLIDGRGILDCLIDPAL